MNGFKRLPELEKAKEMEIVSQCQTLYMRVLRYAD